MNAKPNRTKIYFYIYSYNLSYIACVTVKAYGTHSALGYIVNIGEWDEPDHKDQRNRKQIQSQDLESDEIEHRSRELSKSINLHILTDDD